MRKEFFFPVALVVVLLTLLFLALAQANAQEVKIINIGGDRDLIVFLKTAALEETIHVLWGVEGTPKENLLWDSNTAKLVPPEEANTFWFASPEGWITETSFEPLGSDWWQIPSPPVKIHQVLLPFVSKGEIPLVVRMSGDQELVRFERSVFCPESGDWDPWHVLWGIEGTPKENIPWGGGNVAEMRPPEGAETLHFRAPVGWALETEFEELEWDWWNIPPAQ